MIRKTSLTEAVSGLNVVLVALQQSAKGNTGTDGANLTYAVSVLQADAGALITGQNLSSSLANCFTLAITAGATLAGMTAVYTAAAALAPGANLGRAVRAACLSYAALAMGRILSGTTFTSRDDVDAALTQIGAAFASVESAAGNTLQTALYQALVVAHAAVTNDLTTRSYPLPRMVTYEYGATLAALTLAQRLYGDASRAAELALENGVFHPAFMPLTGSALSA